ncbi:hypothetical protein AS159_09255 [Thermotoga sp. Ku-13t]|uniref:hypothetical protein n=1 Tax=Thermotoga sp. Ku-13t TaxID=1755813 RepID=UPI0013ED7D6F|nr:hypothetical protein [Thermotoga sp. Ku-13t]KAF2957209.1 hypothetical protein AS159_09255 [Thermotoga sp. Ku-13t]
MRKAKILFLLAAAVLILIVASCGPIVVLPKYGIPLNIVEAGVIRDNLLEDLASWCANQNDLVMLYYPSTTLFSNRGIGAISSTDKYVLMNNEIAGTYLDETELDETKTQISNWLQPVEDLEGNLSLRLEPNDLLGTTWDLVIGVGSEEKSAIITPESGYVLVQFENQNGVYTVTSVELEQDWRNLDVPKNIPASQLKGYAFFKIENGVITASRVILP